MANSNRVSRDATPTAEQHVGRALPVLIFIHGTGAAGAKAAPSEPRRWWQQESQFDRWVSDRLRGPGGEDLRSSGLVERFRWSGLNSEKAREDAASELLGLMQRQFSGRPIHILAHSHGGNVARRAVELSAAGDDKDKVELASVTSFGTPFFQYSPRRILISAGAYAIVAAAAYFGAEAARQMIQSPLVSVASNLFLLCLMFVYALVAVSRLASALPLRSSIIKRLTPPPWKNFYTSNDEAISLLMSLNQTVSLMRRKESGRWLGSTLGFGYFLAIALMLLLIVLLGFGSHLGGGDESESVQQLFDMILGLVAVGFIFSVALRFLDQVLDIAITAKLKATAYGDDLFNGMNKVERYPWRDHEHCAVQVPMEIEIAMEHYVVSNTGLLWANIRGAMIPNTPFLEQDMRQVVETALTGDELAHTVYYHAPEFADLIAETLAATGDWSLAPPPDAARRRTSASR